MVAAAYLLALAWLVPPANWDSMTYNLARVLLFEEQRTLLLHSITTLRQAVFPLGSDILAYLMLRLGSDYGVGLFSWLSWLAIVSGTYTLARRYSSGRIAITSAPWIAPCEKPVYTARSASSAAP